MTDQKRKIPWIPIILSIFYFALVGIAIYLNITTKSNFAFSCCVKLSVVATVIAIIALFTLEKKDSDEKHKQKIAGFVFMHLILWGAMFFLPFGDYPKISLAALILFAINEAGLTASLSSEEKEKKSKEGMTAVAENAIRAAFFLIVLIVILHFVKVIGADRKFSSFFNSFKTEISSNSKSDNSPVIDEGGYMPEDERAGSMIATVKGYISPFDFKTNTPFMSTAEGLIDLNSTSNAAVNVTIYFNHSGDIILDNGTVQIANEKGGQITGTWSQPKSGLSGSYLMDVSDQFAIVDLEYNGQNITTIELVSN